MLTKRTNILFDEELWKKATALAKKHGISAGEIVRIALKEKIAYEEDLAQRKRVIDHIKRIRPPASKTPIDYKALINEGQRF